MKKGISESLRVLISQFSHCSAEGNAEVLQLSRKAHELLMALDTPFERGNFVNAQAQRTGFPARDIDAILDDLIERGWIAAPSGTTQPNVYSDIYSGWRSQRGMLRDTARTAAFQRAIDGVATARDLVVDVGSGSGILSLFAARAGAAKVYGLELTSMADDAQALAEANGFGDRIEFLQIDAAQFAPAQPIDLLMGEWLGNFLIDEWRHFEAFARLRDNYLRENGVVLPRKASLYLSPIDDSRLYMERGDGYWERPVYGFDFRHAGERQFAAPKRFLVQAHPHTLLGTYTLLDLDCNTDSSAAFFFEKSTAVEIACSAVCHGFIGYFSVELAPGIVLDTSPFSLQTHWQQSYFPFKAFALRSGDILNARVRTFIDATITAPVVEISYEVERNGIGVHADTRSYPLSE